MILSKLSDWWNNKGFEFLIIASLLFLFIYFLFRRNCKGSWNISNLPKPASNFTRPNYTRPNYSSRKKYSRGETICRHTLESIFRRPFPSARPKYLNNSVTGMNLELDCYNPQLKLAVEYNGKQHYKYVPHFHKNKEAFRNQQYRDYMKKQMCKELGITLIDVPYTVKPDDIRPFLIEKLRRLRYLR